jgi:hypothetical protein
MKFTIDFAAMAKTLPVMLYGMLGGLAVMLVICLILMGMYRLGKKSK